MTAKIRHLVEFDDGEVRWTHDIPEGSRVDFLNMTPTFVARVTGTAHTPYWLKRDGGKSKKGP